MLSLKTKTFVLLLLILLLSVIPLMIYYHNAMRALSDLGMDPAVEASLSKSIALSQSNTEKIVSADALKKYNQIKVLKNRIVGQVVAFSLVYSAVLFLISLAAGYFFISKITRPLEDLTEATHKLSRDQLDYKLREDAGGEVGRLVQSFNRMADDLKTARKHREIAERRATWQRVARTIAHEIKNPLTPIKLSTERLYDKYLNGSGDFPEVLKSTTQTILAEISNLQKLVDTFHRYAKFPDPVLKPESINQIIKGSVSLYESEDVSLTVQLAPDVPDLPLDHGQIKEALTNLIKNSMEAIQSKQTKGVITLVTKNEKDAVAVTVTDNGCGISPANQKKLFQPYFTTKEHGNGIGLALTERIISLNNGKITVESEQDQGTTFFIEFKKTIK